MPGKPVYRPALITHPLCLRGDEPTPADLWVIGQEGAEIDLP